MTDANDTTTAPHEANSDPVAHYLTWFDEHNAPLETVAAVAVSSGLGFPGGTFRQIACDLAILAEAIEQGELNDEIIRLGFLGVQSRARAALALCHRWKWLGPSDEHAEPDGARPNHSSKRGTSEAPEIIEYGE